MSECACASLLIKNIVRGDCCLWHFHFIPDDNSTTTLQLTQSHDASFYRTLSRWDCNAVCRSQNEISVTITQCHPLQKQLTIWCISFFPYLRCEPCRSCLSFTLYVTITFHSKCLVGALTVNAEFSFEIGLTFVENLNSVDQLESIGKSFSTYWYLLRWWSLATCATCALNTDR